MLYIFAIIIITLLIIILLYSNSYKLKNIRDISLLGSTNFGELKSGDIVLTKWNHSFMPFYLMRNVLYTTATRDIYTHAGIIWKDKDGEPYIVHYMINNPSKCYLHNEKPFTGLNVNKLKEFMSLYSGNVFICKINKELNSDEMDYFIKQSKDHEFYTSSLELLNCHFRFKDKWVDKNFCTTFLVKLLNYCKVTDNSYNNLTPGDYAKGDRLVLINGYKFSKPRILLGYGKNNVF